MKLPGYLSIALFSATILSSNAQPGFIAGGQISYECPGFNFFQIAVSIYKPCDYPIPLDGTPGSLVAPDIFIYAGNSTNPFTENYPQITNIEQVMLPPDCSGDSLCFEKATYKYGIFLINNGISYHAVWQRCCLQPEIQNVDSAGRVGHTLAITITPESRMVCNSTPVFLHPLFCSVVGENLQFDHSAFDVDGDSLVYHFCAPLRGGGTHGNGNYYPDGQEPIDLPPPHQEVPYNQTVTSAMPVPGLNIDSLTGMITGTPDSAGLYLYGICVDEYRDGILLSESKFEWTTTISGVVSGTKTPEKPIVWNIYPNPTADAITIDIPGNEKGIPFFLRNTQGQVLKQFSAKSTMTFSMDDLPNGVYFLEAIFDGVVQQKKVVKR